MRIYLYSVCCILLLSCQEKGKPKIGFLCYAYTDVYFVNNRNNFVEKAQQLGAEVIDKNAQNNESIQFDQAVELMSQGVKVLVIVPVNTIISAAIVRKAKEKNVKVISYDRMIHNCDLDYYISFDSRKVGEIMATEAVRQKPKGNYVLLWGDKSDDNADLVKSGILKVLQPHINNGSIQVLYQNYIENWSLENAEHEVAKVVDLSNNKRIDAIVSSYDGMTRGALNVLKAHGMLNDVYSCGQNAEIASLKLIYYDEQSVTVNKSPKTTGYAAAELAVKIATNSSESLKTDVNGSMFNGYKNVPSILLDPVLVNKSNIKKVMEADGVKEDSYQ